MGCKACDKPKPNYRKGLWSLEEDQKLHDYILLHDHGCCSALPTKAGKTDNSPPHASAFSCRGGLGAFELENQNPEQCQLPCNLKEFLS
jgi:hypothetical protein